MRDDYEPMRKVPGFHVEEDDVICAGPTPIRVKAIRRDNGVPVAICIVGNVSLYPVTFTCESLARFVSTNGKSDLVMTERTKLAA